MKGLEPHETDLVGQWLLDGKKVVGDESCERIEWLVRHLLKRISADASGWDILYIDPNDGRYWELTYPQSHMHGGGPPRLSCISLEEAKKKYDIS